MSVFLQTDFMDYYDHWFAASQQSSHLTLHRMSRGGMSRPDMLTYMERLKLITPLHGVVKELYPRLIATMNLDDQVMERQYADCLLFVVVYTDPYAHAGEGKVMMSLSKALQQYPDHYATQYIPANGLGTGVSLRYLRIGKRQFWLRYQSADDWRSNCGDVTIELLCEEKKMPMQSALKSDHPLFAVDFVVSNKMYAVDFNSAPGIKGSPLRDLLGGLEIYSEIEAWLVEKERAKTQ